MYFRFNGFKKVRNIDDLIPWKRFRKLRKFFFSKLSFDKLLILRDD